MDIRHWYRCDTCSQRYSPQQVQALLDLEKARAGDPDGGSPAEVAVSLRCRKKGCCGTLRPTGDVDRDGRD